MRSSIERETMRLFGKSIVFESITPGSPTLEPPFGFGAVRRADVDPEVGHLRRVLAVGGLHQVDRLLADDTEHVAAAAEEADALADEHLRIPSADRAMDRRSRRRRCTGRSTPISSMWPSSMIVGEPPGLISAMLLPATSVVTRSAKVDGFFAPDARRRSFEAGRGGRIQQTLQECERATGSACRRSG